MRTGEVRSGSANGGRRDTWRAGIAAGLLAGLAMMAFMAAASALDGSGPLDALRAVGTSLRGSDPSPAGALPGVWGILLHLAVGALFGLGFMVVAPKDASGAAGAVLGAGYAVIVMAFVVPFVVPALAPGLHARLPMHGGAWVVAHAVFGAVAGIGPSLRRRTAARSRRGAPDERPGVLQPRTSS